MSSIIIRNKSIDTPIIDILKKIKSELINGKLKDIRIKGEEIVITCPFHSEGKEEDPDCRIYCGEDNSKVKYSHFHCFACSESGPFYHFVGACFDKDDEFGKKWLIDNFGNNYVVYDVVLPSIDLDEKTIKTSYLNESILEGFQSYHPYMTKRKLTPKVCSLFEIKYDPETQCLVFPVRDKNGKLLMLTRRSVNTKKFIIDENKEKPVYLYYYIKDKNIEEVTITESQINALTLWGYGIPAVALFGTGTKYQYDILNKSNIKHIYLCLDGDSAGRKGTLKLIQNLRKDIFVDVIDMPQGKDVNDLTEEEFNKLNILESWNWLEKYKLKMYNKQ